MTRQRRSLAIAALLATPFLLACPGFGDEEVGGIPEFPTYDVDVKPILDASCVPCHAVPPQAGAPPGFRLDQYEDDVNGVVGAYVVRFDIQFRAVDAANMPPATRPDLALTPEQRETIDRWVDQGAPKTVSSAGT